MLTLTQCSSPVSRLPTTENKKQFHRNMGDPAPPDEAPAEAPASDAAAAEEAPAEEAAGAVSL